MNTYRKSERGQIVVIFVVALVALLALTALAIDGGMILSDRRVAQAGADAAALGGAGAAAREIENAGITYSTFDCSSAAVLDAIDAASQAAIDAAAANNFLGLANDGDLNPNNETYGVEVLCEDDAASVDRHIDVMTTITSETSTSFLHLFNSGPMTNTVTAVVRVRPPTPLAMGNAIVTFSPLWGTKTGGLDFTGGAVLHVTDGGMFSNSSIRQKGSGSIWVHDGLGDVMDGSVRCLMDCDEFVPGNMDPDPVDICTAADNCPGLRIQPITMPTPACGANRGAINGSGTYDPGTYSSASIGNGDVVKLNPGLYCFNGVVKITGGSLTTVADADGHLGVTIFLKKANGDWNITGGTITLVSPVNADQVTAGSIQGVLLYLEDGNTNEIKITGNGTGSYSGLIYGRDAGLYVRGSSADTFNGQILVRYMDNAGTSDMKVSFVDNTNFGDPTFLDVIR